MGWDPLEEWLIGHPLPTIQHHALALHPASMRLLLMSANNEIVKEYPLIGKTRKKGEAWVRGTLKQFGIDTSAYKMDLHYEIPPHEIDYGAPFKSLPEGAYTQFSKLRGIGHEMISRVAAQFEHASPVRTWPHHFDIGSYIPLAWDETGEVEKSITIGLSIQDIYVNEYYFYVTQWSKEGKINYESLPEISPGEFCAQGRFKGFILRLSELLQSEETIDQKAMIESFLRKGIQISLDLLQVSDSGNYHK